MGAWGGSLHSCCIHLQHCLTAAHHIRRFNCINENDFSILVKDDDIGSDDFIGKGEGTLAKVRTYGTDRQDVTMISKKTHKQHGFVAVSMTFAKNNVMQPPVSLHASLPMLQLR